MPSLSDDSEGAPQPGNRWFAITPASDHDQVLELFTAVGWAPAILEYREKVRGRSYPYPVALRRARPHETGIPDNDRHQSET
jgi:hypothetical protein